MCDNRTETGFSTLNSDEMNPPSMFGGRYTDISFTPRDALLLALSLIPTALVCFGDAWTNSAWEALYIPLAHLGTLLLALFAAGRRAHLGGVTLYLIVCDIMLIALGVFHRNAFLMGANCFAIPFLTALTMLTATGVNRSETLSMNGLFETLVRSLRGLFEYIPLPFVRLKNIPGGARRAGTAVLALIVCIPILLIVLVLLASADEVFLSIFDALFSKLPEFSPGSSLPRLTMTVATALMLFSWCFALTQRGRDYKAMRRPSVPAIFPSILLALLNAVYLLFVYIQFSNLFGGTEHAAMTGGYAQYARSGFFQLVAVSMINLMVLSMSIRSSHRIWIRIMCLVMIACTAIILVSALWRMRLYVNAYGLTVLRVLTLWGIAAIGVMLILALATLFLPRFRAFRAALLCLLALWVGLNAVNIDAIIANYNVNAYLSGEIAELDVEYLRSLSASDAALKRLETP